MGKGEWRRRRGVWFPGTGQLKLMASRRSRGRFPGLFLSACPGSHGDCWFINVAPGILRYRQIRGRYAASNNGAERRKQKGGKLVTADTSFKPTTPHTSEKGSSRLSAPTSPCAPLAEQIGRPSAEMVQVVQVNGQGGLRVPRTSILDVKRGRRHRQCAYEYVVDERRARKGTRQYWRACAEDFCRRTMIMPFSPAPQLAPNHKTGYMLAQRHTEFEGLWSFCQRPPLH